MSIWALLFFIVLSYCIIFNISFNSAKKKEEEDKKRKVEINRYKNEINGLDHMIKQHMKFSRNQRKRVF